MHALKITVLTVDMRAATDLIMILSFETPWVITLINLVRAFRYRFILSKSNLL